MTTLSQYLRAEIPDETEDVGFYIPGGVNWAAEGFNGLMMSRRTASRVEIYYLEGDSDEANSDY